MAICTARRRRSRKLYLAFIYCVPYPARPDGQAWEATRLCTAAMAGPQGLARLGKLSGSSFMEDLSEGPHGAVARRCTGDDLGLMAVAIHVPSDVIRMVSLRCARGGYCLRRPGSRFYLSESRHGWFAACVPVACLGHDSALLALAWRLCWHRLLPLRGRHGRLMAKNAPDSEVRVLRVFGNSRAQGPTLVESLLAKASLAGAGSDGPFDIVTVTDDPGLAEPLRTSLPPPLKLRFLSPPEIDGNSWKFRWFDVEKHLLAYVSHLRRRGLGNRLVIYVDGFDTAWLGCRRNLEQALDALNRSVFFGVQFEMYPAGERGYPRPAASYKPATTLPPCREPRFPAFRWELEPVDEHAPCLAQHEVSIVGADLQHAIYLNGGVYGGRAASLEVMLRELLAKQRLLRDRNNNGHFYRIHGRTHQYLWNQYFLDRPDMVALDYGSAFVVNLAPLSVATRLFGLRPDTGLIHSVLFQKPVCIAHANGGGWADDTLRLLRGASAFKFDTATFVGIRQEIMDDVSEMGVVADLDKHDRIVSDRNLCFHGLEPSGSLPFWHGEVQVVDLLTPQSSVALRGLQFMVIRERPSHSTSDDDFAFEVISVQETPLHASGLHRGPNATGSLIGRVRLDISPFHLTTQQGACLAWRCRSRCDLTYKQFYVRWPPGAHYRSRTMKGGSWSIPGHSVKVGTTLHFSDSAWIPRAYAVGAEAEVRGISFFPEPGSGPT